MNQNTWRHPLQSPATITYLVGDALEPTFDSKAPNQIIAHICNDIGVWGKGFVLGVSLKWPYVKTMYKDWSKTPSFELGRVLHVRVGASLWVSNMIAQHGIYPDKAGRPPIRYDALEKCLLEVAAEANRSFADIHMPRIGCGLAGSTWDKIEPIIQRTLIARGHDVYVYDLTTQPDIHHKQ